MMTRRDFVALASALNRTRPCEPDAENHVWSSTVQGIKDVCAASNPRFDANRFHAACRADSAEHFRWIAFGEYLKY